MQYCVEPESSLIAPQNQNKEQLLAGLMVAASGDINFCRYVNWVTYVGFKTDTFNIWDLVFSKIFNGFDF